MLKVRAKKLGYLHGGRKRPGDEFSCSRQEFSDRWMELIEEPKPKPESKPKPKRKRRTKAEIEAAKSAEPSEAANTEAEAETPEVTESE